MFLLRIGQKLIKPLMVIVCLLLIGVLKLGFIFLLIALLPSMAVYFVDTDYDRITFRTVFACNLAAIIPTITPIFEVGLKFKTYDVSSIIANPTVWFFIYGAAGIGWAMIYFGSTVARSILEIQYKLRTAYLEKSQERILEEWGEEVKNLPKEEPDKKK